MSEDGYDLLSTSRYLGHADIQSTADIYAHIDTGKHRVGNSRLGSSQDQRSDNVVPIDNERG